MLLAILRPALLLAALIVSLHVSAATRFWTLTGVRFSGGSLQEPAIGVATGSFSYDDATQTIASWYVRVSPAPGWFPSFTYVPGNSVAYTFQSPTATQPTLIFSSVGGGPPPMPPDILSRFLSITPLTPLDGSNATVPLNLLDYLSKESVGEDYGRPVIAGSLTLASLPPPVAIVTVDEFYHAVLRHYFITGDAAEKQDLDTGVHPGWVRTGESFKAYAMGSSAAGTINPVCRYYGKPQAGLDSHFYSADAAECSWVYWREPAWLFESDNVFQINLPDPASGACPAATVPVYRLMNQHGDWNHRYTTSPTIRAQMLAAGYVAEGYGRDGIVMCALQ